MDQVPDKVYKNRVFHLVSDLLYNQIVDEISEAQELETIGVSQ